MRVGIGYDIHQLVEDRPLVLGGLTIPFEKGLAGHSDADVLTHAVCDALLGAAALGDIGQLFPDSDEAYRGIYSIELLKRTVQLVRTAGYSIQNIDCTVFAQAPKIAPHRQEIRTILARTIEIDTDRINIKATTTEGLGNIGRGDGMAAMCVALIE